MAQQMDPLSLFINMTVCWALHFADRSEEAIRETRRTRELAPGFQEAGNLLMSLYEHLGRFEEAARLTSSSRCYGVRVDGKRSSRPFGPAARRPTGESASTISTRAQPKRLRPFTTATRRCTRGLGDTERAIDHVEALIESRASNAVFLGVEPCLRSLHSEPALPARAQPAGCAHGFSTAYSVDIIGTGTPARAARRTTDPCSASTSIRLPCDRSISSDDRMVPGMPSTYASDAVDDVGGNRHAFRARDPLDLAAPVEELRADLLVGPERSDRQPRRAGEAGERHQKDELLPDRHAAVADRLRLDVGARPAPLESRERAPTAAADRRRPRRRRCGDACRSARSRRAQRAPSRCRSCRRSPAARRRRRDLRDAVDAVLQRQHRRRRTEHRRDQRQRRRRCRRP